MTVRWWQRISRIIQNNLFDDFRADHLRINQKSDRYDLCVIGSDEVFNCLSTGGWGFTSQLFGNVPEADSVITYEKSSLAPPGQSLAFSLGDEKGFEWIGAYDITADELLAGTDTANTESKTAQAQMLILELLADGKRMPSAELEKAVNERGISSRTMRTAKSRIGDRLVTEKDGTAWVCYLRD